MVDAIDTHGHDTADAEALYPGITEKDPWTDLTAGEKAAAEGQYLAQSAAEVEAQMGIGEGESS